MEQILIVENKDILLNPNVALQLVQYEQMLKNIKAEYDELKQAVLMEMESRGVIKVDTDVVCVSYIAPADRETFDSKKFRSEQPDLYDEFVKITPVKASIRVKVKEHE